MGHSAHHDFVTISTTDHVATVTLDRRPVNAVNQQMYREIKDFFSRIEEYAPDARVAVLIGEGRHFCGGNDLEEFRDLTPENSRVRMLTVREALWSIYDCALPVIAAVRGVAVGTGVALAASCDLVVAATGAQFGLPEVGVGVMGGAKHLSRLVPQGVVRRMHYTAELVPVEELVQYGGVVQVVPGDELAKAATELAQRITRHSPVAIRTAKRSLNQIEYMDLKSGYQFEQSLTGEMARSEDSKEAVAAFFERREPRYTGR